MIYAKQTKLVASLLVFVVVVLIPWDFQLPLDLLELKSSLGSPIDWNQVLPVQAPSQKSILSPFSCLYWPWPS